MDEDSGGGPKQKQRCGRYSWTMVDPLEQKNKKGKTAQHNNQKRGGAHESPAKFLMGIPP